MLFNSYGFVLGFLPLSLVLFYTVSRRNSQWGKLLLLLLSVVFICSGGIYHGVIALASAMINFWICSCMNRNPNRKKLLLTAGIVFNIGLLCFFKYAPAMGRTVAFPLGISFYCFQQIAFLADSYHQPVAIGVTDYVLSVLFFPKAVQGPIPYGAELLGQLADPGARSFRFENFSRGLFLFAMGLGKKVLLADKFAIIADYGFGTIGVLTAFEAMLTILAYTFQLYFDFSGYSDMAVAVGWMFGIDLPENFNSPYKAKNITDFWRRWHITLSRFLTRYIYIPLGGNRRGTLRTWVNILIVYLVSGIWHGTGMTFLVWGLLHAAASIAYRLLKKHYDRLPGPVQWAIQFAFINLTWVFFRAPDLGAAFALLGRLAAGSWMPHINGALAESLMQPTFISIVSQFLPIHITVMAGFAAALAVVALMKNSAQRCQDFRPGFASFAATYFLLVAGILSMSGVSSFLYTNF